MCVHWNVVNDDNKCLFGRLIFNLLTERKKKILVNEVFNMI